MLRNYPRWGGYSRVDSESKVPSLPSNLPHLWMMYEAAKSSSKTGHVGYAFWNTDNIYGIDLDDCIVNGVLTDVAERIVAVANTYTEVSVSGTGLKLWLIGQPPQGLPCRFTAQGQVIEVYNHGRWFMSTGTQFGSQSNLTRNSDIGKLLKELCPPKPVPQRIERQQQSGDSATDLANMCKSFPAAISGKGGHGVCMSLARRLALKGCDANTIVFLMDTYWNHHCQPPWSRRELEHKALDAVKRK